MKKMMTFLLVSIGAITAIVFIVGLFLPKERTFTKTAVLNSDVTKVFNLVTDFKIKQRGEMMLKKLSQLTTIRGRKFQKKEQL
ncbi:MAG: hypothetical protein HRU69_13260 [Flammeovirgaceae bacterium]|nr:MAG: hypothetical protein HRU69_13260 [Flammeovirgaceae bacterium]